MGGAQIAQIPELSWELPAPHESAHEAKINHLFCIKVIKVGYESLRDRNHHNIIMTGKSDFIQLSYATCFINNLFEFDGVLII